MGFQLGDPLQDAPAGTLLPALDNDLAVPGVERRDGPLARQLGEDLGLGGRAQDHLARTLVEPADGGRDVADAAADAAGKAGQQALDQCGIGAGAHGGIEIDHRNLAGERKALGDRPGVAGVDRLLGATDELDRLAALQIDARDDHGRTRMPCSCK